ncbi:hypothetical protein GNI_040050 [Gregarina niphandrodes]|uniref:Uncharacterized protein n=1 Tax=Gregarina niphandrodes TaxID=110365 RepID=A0A023BAE6_GRENI|nr:hypothetical protein GNI_040050 [Gregarina niphandrodes]EZG78205.1 hypothetical protein GNI_040050 [Gregarina niphandrodes]|eukprot:XP_011129425.1 hypothetical protein GNI_040050 [Gregarina niphandrodes]
MLVQEVQDLDCWFEVFHGPYSFIKDGQVSQTWHGLLLVELQELLDRTLWTCFPPRVYFSRCQDRCQDRDKVPASYQITRIDLSAEALPFDRWTLIQILLTLTTRPQWLNLMVTCMSSDGDVLAPYCLGDVEPVVSSEALDDGLVKRVWPECVIRRGNVYKCANRLDKIPGSAAPCEMTLLQQKLDSLRILRQGSATQSSTDQSSTVQSSTVQSSTDQSSTDQSSTVQSSFCAVESSFCAVESSFCAVESSGSGQKLAPLLDPASLCGKMNGHHHIPLLVNKLVGRLLTLCPQLGPAAVASVTNSSLSEKTDNRFADKRFILGAADDCVTAELLLPSAACGRLLNSLQHARRLPFEYMMRNWHASADGDDSNQLEMRQLEATKLEATTLESTKLEATKLEATKLEATKLEATKREARQLEMRQLGARVSYGLQLLVSGFVEEDRRGCFAPLVRQLGLTVATISPAVVAALEPFEVRLYNRICGTVSETEDQHTILEEFGRHITDVLTPYIWMSRIAEPGSKPGLKPELNIFDMGVLPSKRAIDDLLALVREAPADGKCGCVEKAHGCVARRCRYTHCCGARLLSEVDVGLDVGEVEQLVAEVAGEGEVDELSRMLGLDGDDPEELTRRLEQGMKVESDLFAGMDFNGDRPKRLKPEEEQELKNAFKDMGLGGLLDDWDISDISDDSSQLYLDEKIRKEQTMEEKFDAMFREELTKLIVGDDGGDLDDTSALCQEDSLTKMFDGIKPCAVLRSQLRNRDNT